MYNPVAEETFNAYHNANPKIYKEFRHLALEAIRRGHKNFSAKMIFEIIRWNGPVSGDDGFKLNNNYHSFYARMFEKEFTNYTGFFRKRKSKADSLKAA